MYDCYRFDNSLGSFISWAISSSPLFIYFFFLFFIFLFLFPIGCPGAAPLHNQHNAATTPLLSAVNKTHSSTNRTVNKLTGNSSSARAAIDGGHSPSPDFNARYNDYFDIIDLIYLVGFHLHSVFDDAKKFGSIYLNSLLLLCHCVITTRRSSSIPFKLI